MRRISLLFLSFLFSTLFADAYKQVYHLDGLPQNDAQCLFKDSKGLIWIGTLDGLHRYDGYSYKSYYVNEGKSSICGNMVISMAEDTLGHIWIATYGKGVCRFNPDTEEFISYRYGVSQAKQFMPDDVGKIMIDHTNTIWVATQKGLQRITMDATMTTIVSIRDMFDDKLNITSIVEDGFNQIWAGGNGRVYLIHNPYSNAEIKQTMLKYNGAKIAKFKNGVLLGGTNIIAALKNDKAKHGYDFFTILNLKDFGIDYISDLVYNKGKIWAASRNGVDVFFRHEDGQWDHEKNFKNDKSENDITSNIVVSIISDDNDQVWIGSRGGGVSMIQTSPKSFMHFHKSELSTSLSDNATRCMFIDSYKQLWIGTEAGGVNVNAAFSDDFSSGFTRINVNTRQHENRVYAIEEMPTPLLTSKSLIFLGTSFPNNLVAVDPLSYEVKKIYNAIGFVFALERYNDTTLWVGTYYNGLWRLSFDRSGELVKKENFLPTNDSNLGLTSNIIRYIKKDSKGNLWVATDKGLNLLEKGEVLKEKPHFRNFTQDCRETCFPFDYNLQIHEAKNGHLFLGTMGGGLIEVIEKPQDNDYTFKQITKENGLPNNTVKAIQEDENGNLWLSTNMGVARYNYISSEIVIFDEYDGLQDNEFSEICSVTRDDGVIFLGGINGFNVFDPKEVSKDTIPPKLFFTSLSLKNKLISTGEEVHGRVLLKHSIEDLKHLSLKYKERDFTIAFVGVQYNSPIKNKYRYKLEGYDDTWQDASVNIREAKYTNLNHGEYTLLITAANSDGVWVKEPLELFIIIATPFWLKWWFISLIVILISIVLVFSYRHHFSRLEAQKRKLANMVEEQTAQLYMANEELKELNATKDKFFSIIAHDLRNPLNSFLGFTELLNADIQRFSIDRIQQMVGVMNHTAKSLYSLLENLLQWSRLQRGVVQFEDADMDLRKALKDVMTLSNDVAQAKGVKLENKVSRNLYVNYDKNTLEMIVRNLLSNAIKFTPTGGNVMVSAEEYDANHIKISIKDTGIGMSSEMQSNIFRVDKNTGRPGTNNEPSSGLGLILCKEFVEKRNGKLWVESVEMEGTTFHFTITRSMSNIELE